MKFVHIDAQIFHFEPKQKFRYVKTWRMPVSCLRTSSRRRGLKVSLNPALAQIFPKKLIKGVCTDRTDPGI